LRLAFLGTSIFACPSLERLAGAHDVSLVVTQPDRPAGRKGRLREPPIKGLARQLGLRIVQPERIHDEDAIRAIQAAAPEAIVVAAYGKILKPQLFEIPPHGTINIHASLLPAYRGAAPVQWSIIRGEHTTGVTTFLIDRGMDTGKLLLRRSLSIESDETAGELEGRLANLGASAIVETLEGIRTGALLPDLQPEEGISYAPPLTREDGRIDWSQSAVVVHNLIRGTNPWPGAWTTLGSERVKIHRSVRTNIQNGGVNPGQIALPETGRLFAGCGDELIELVEIQREARPRLDGKAFLNGLRGAGHFA